MTPDAIVGVKSNGMKCGEKKEGEAEDKKYYRVPLFIFERGCEGKKEGLERERKYIWENISH